MIVQDGDKTYILNNLATMIAMTTIADDETEEVQDYIAKEPAKKVYVLGDADNPLIARKWRGHVFAWSFANNMWQIAVSHTKTIAYLTQAKREGKETKALTTIGESLTEGLD